MARKQWAASWFVLAAILTAAGCEEKGPKLGKVSGTILLDDQPVEGAFVEFSPLFEGGKQVVAAEKTDADGHFSMQYSVDRPGVLLGEHQVQISTQDWDKQPDGSNKVIKERIPKHYIGLDSILTFEVQEGKNVADFNLTTKNPK